RLQDVAQHTPTSPLPLARHSLRGTDDKSPKTLRIVQVAAGDSTRRIALVRSSMPQNATAPSASDARKTMKSNGVVVRLAVLRSSSVTRSASSRLGSSSLLTMQKIKLKPVCP